MLQPELPGCHSLSTLGEACHMTHLASDVVSERYSRTFTPDAVPISCVFVRIGVFGGTFDPPHVGHLVTAVNVRYALGLDRVLLVVANVPWQKEGQRDISDGEDRLALVEAAVGPVAGLEASRIELDRDGPSYTADTLAELAARHPGAD